MLEDQFRKILPDLESAIDTFNTIFPEDCIIEPSKTNGLVNKLISKQYNRFIGGKPIAYSAIDGIIGGTSVVSAGYDIKIALFN